MLLKEVVRGSSTLQTLYWLEILIITTKRYILSYPRPYAFYFVCTRLLQSWHAIEDSLKCFFLTFYCLYEW